MPHHDIEGVPTNRDLELAHGLAAGELNVWILVCPMDDTHPFVTCLGKLGEFSWYKEMKKPYSGALVDVWALPEYAELGPGTFLAWEGNLIGSYTYGERAGRLVVCLSEKRLHGRILFMAGQWDEARDLEAIADMGFCPECACLLPHETIDKELFEAEPCRLINGVCPTCGWT